MLRSVKWVVSGLALAVLTVTCAGYGLAQMRCVPNEALKISRDFLDLLQAGDIEHAYLLTDRGPSVGSTRAAFETKIREQSGLVGSATHRDIDIIGRRHDIQSCGNRLRRWILGRKVDPDQLSVDYNVGVPFEVRLRSDDHGQWRVIYFQSHAG